MHSAAPVEGVHFGTATDAMSAERDSMAAASSGGLAQGNVKSSEQSALSTLSGTAADLQPISLSDGASQDSKGTASAVSCRSETSADGARFVGAFAAKSAGMPVPCAEGLTEQRSTETQARCIKAAGVEGRPQDVHDKSEQPSTTLHEIGGESRAASVREKAEKLDRDAKSRCRIS